MTSQEIRILGLTDFALYVFGSAKNLPKHIPGIGIHQKIKIEKTP